MTIKAAIVAIAAASAALAAAAGEAAGAPPVYVEASAFALLPAGGSALRGSPAAALRAGVAPSDPWAFEAECGAAARDLAAFLSARALWRFMGYERLDPFLSLGWCAVFAHRRVTGPEFGFGAWYYLTDRWALRADARCATFVDDSCRPAFLAGLGFGYTF